MKSCLKINFLFICVFFLVGCSSPKPPTLENKKYDTAVNTIFYRNFGNKLFPNSEISKDFENKLFMYEIYGYPIAESKKILFIFLASHSHTIKIIANKKMIDLYTNYFNEIGISPNNIRSELREDKFDYVKFIFSGEKIN